MTDIPRCINNNLEPASDNDIVTKMIHTIGWHSTHLNFTEIKVYIFFRLLSLCTNYEKLNIDIFLSLKKKAISISWQLVEDLALLLPKLLGEDEDDALRTALVSKLNLTFSY